MVRILFAALMLLAPSIAMANIDVACADQDCMHNGWQVQNLTTGQIITVACRDADCNVHGWSSSVSTPANTLRTEDTICKPGGCFSEGWRGYATQNGLLTNEVTCLGNMAAPDCLTNGWATFVPNRGSYFTQCAQNDCRNIGWDINGRPATRCKPGGCFISGWTIYTN